MMKNVKRFFIPAVFALLFYSCSPGSLTCSFDPCAMVAPAGEIQNVQNYLSSNSLVAAQHCSGLFYRIENPGSGAAPSPCSSISITYKTYFFNGSLIQQQTTPLVIPLGSSITATRITMPLIKTGGRVVFYVPPSLAYGSQEVRDQNGNLVIPANSYLVYEVDLVAVQ